MAAIADGDRRRATRRRSSKRNNSLASTYQPDSQTQLSLCWLVGWVKASLDLVTVVAHSTNLIVWPTVASSFNTHYIMLLHVCIHVSSV